LGGQQAKLFAAKLEPFAHQSGGIMQQQAKFFDSVIFHKPPVL
jgi:hypothetical protein